MAEEEPDPNELPDAIFFLMASDFVEGFQISFHTSIIILFLRNKLGFSGKEVTTIQRTMQMANLMMTPVGALFVDSMGNKFILMILAHIRNTFIRIVYIFTALPSLRSVARYIVYAIFGFGMSTNFIFNCVYAPFEGDQFKLPQQLPALIKYYRVQYVMTNFSAILGYFIAPLIKKKVPCFGEQDCYVLPFSINIILMVVSLMIFLSGTRHYVVTKPGRNMTLDIPKCIWHGATQSMRHWKSDPKKHWMDHASPKFDDQLIQDIKRVFSMIIIFTVIPIYWAVYDQFEVVWLLQATRTDGRIGSFTIIEEHFGLVNPVLAIILAPLFIHFLDPCIWRCKMDRAFRRMIFGALMVVLAFVLAGVVESFIKSDSPVLPNEFEAQVRIYNGFNCSALLESKLFENDIEIMSYGSFADLHVLVDEHQSAKLIVRGSCFKEVETVVYLDAGASTTFYIQNKEGIPVLSSLKQQVDKPETGHPILTIVGADLGDAVTLRDSNNVDVPALVVEENIAGTSVISGTSRTLQVLPDSYSLIINEKKIHKFDMHSGGIYLMTVDGTKIDLFTITAPNSVHMAWMLPQSILLIFGEVYFSITVSEIVYSEAPGSLRVLTNAFYLFANGVGDIIFVMMLHYVDVDQDHMFYIFALILLMNIVWLFFVGRRFQSRYEGVELM